MIMKYAAMLVEHGHLTPSRMRLFDSEAEAEAHIQNLPQHLPRSEWVRFYFVQKIFLNVLVLAEEPLNECGAV